MNLDEFFSESIIDFGRVETPPLIPLDSARLHLWFLDQTKQFFDDLDAFTVTLGRPTLRDPHTLAQAMSSSSSKHIKDWHHDGTKRQDGKPQEAMIFLWSNMFPTEVKRVGDTEHYSLNPYILYAVNNVTWTHRMQTVPVQDVSERVFFRIISYKDKHW